MAGPVGRIGLRLAQYERGRRKDLEPVGISAVRRRLLFDVRVVRLSRLQGRVQGERRVGVLGQERASVGGVTRLQQNGMALWRTRQRTHPANVELRTALFDHTHPAGINVNAAVPIGEHGDITYPPRGERVTASL